MDEQFLHTPREGDFCRFLSNVLCLCARPIWGILAVTLITLFSAGCNNGISNSKLAYINVHLGDLAIVPEPLYCFPEYKPWAGDPLSGFAKGAGEGVAAVSNVNPGEGDFAGLMALLLIAGGGAVGGTIGAFQAVPEDLSSEIETLSFEFFNNKNINESIAQEIYVNSLQTRGDLNPAVMKRAIPSDGKDDEDSKKAFREYLKRAGKETVLSVDTSAVAFEGGRGRNPSFGLHIKLNTELLSLAEDQILFSKEYEYVGKEHNWVSWSQTSGRVLSEELSKAYEELGRRVYTELIEMPARSIPFKSGVFSSSAEVSGDACFLRPVYPALKLKGPIELFFNRDEYYIEATEVDSLQPVLKWESFPRPRDKTAANAKIINRISDVVYGLRIWRKSAGYSLTLVYERDNLPQPEHKMESSLLPGTDYLWSFQANYKFDGKPREIPWAFYNFMPYVPCGSCYCDLKYIPKKNLFRFKTPDHAIY